MFTNLSCGNIFQQYLPVQYYPQRVVLIPQQQGYNLNYATTAQLNPQLYLQHQNGVSLSQLPYLRPQLAPNYQMINQNQLILFNQQQQQKQQIFKTEELNKPINIQNGFQKNQSQVQQKIAQAEQESRHQICQITSESSLQSTAYDSFSSEKYQQKETNAALFKENENQELLKEISSEQAQADHKPNPEQIKSGEELEEEHEKKLQSEPLEPSHWFRFFNKDQQKLQITNIVKNIVNAFIKFFKEGSQKEQLLQELEISPQNLKLILSNVQNIRRMHRCNNLLIRDLLQNQLTSKAFKFFLQKYAQEWIKNSKIIDKDVYSEVVARYIYVSNQSDLPESRYVSRPTQTIANGKKKIYDAKTQK